MEDGVLYGLEPKWLAKAFDAIAVKMEPGDYVKKVTVRENVCNEVVVITKKDRYFKITGETVTYKPGFQAPKKLAVVIAKAKED